MSRSGAGKVRLGASTYRWYYSRVGVMARLFRPRPCHRCSKETSELYKRWINDLDHYRMEFDRFEAVYCKACIEALWTLDDLNDMVTDV